MRGVVVRYQGEAEGWFGTQGALEPVLRALREVLVEAGLLESVKWGVPCYADALDHNVALLGTLGGAATLSLLRGALVADPAGLLVSPGPNSRSARYVRVGSVDEVAALRPALTALVADAVRVTAEGLTVPPLTDEPERPPELAAALDASAALGAAFEALTPGRRRAWCLVVGGAKTAAAREARVARAVERILAGKGPNDCVCGRTKRPPGCDGSHKEAGVSDPTR